MDVALATGQLGVNLDLARSSASRPELRAQFALDGISQIRQRAARIVVVLARIA
jgi:hypothetical protein